MEKLLTEKDILKQLTSIRTIEKKIQRLFIMINTENTHMMSLYQIGSILQLEQGRIIDIAEDNEDIRVEWIRYRSKYKDFLLTKAIAEKMHQLYLPLLEEIGMLDNEKKGNDLMVNLTMNKSDLTIETLEAYEEFNSDDLGDDDENY